MTKPTLLVSGGPATRPLWPRLSEKYDLVFLYPNAVGQATEAGVTVAPLANWYTPEIREHAINTAAMLSARVALNIPTIQARLAMAYGDAHPPPMLNSRLPEWWAGVAHDRLLASIQVAAMLDTHERKQGRAVGVLAHEDVTLEMRTAISWARARGIPTIHIPHAACHLLPGTRDIHAEARAEYVAASGEYEREFYTRAGVDPTKIMIVGNPSFDYMYEAGELPERAESRSVLGLPGDAKVYLYATTWAQTTSLRSGFDNELNQGLAAFLGCAKNANAIVIIKMHPNQNPEDGNAYVETLKQNGVNGIVTRDHPTYCIRASDVVVSQSPSNMCINAAILGVPSCYIQTEGFDFAHPLPFRCGPEELTGAIGAALDSTGSDAWQDFITYYNAGHPDGMATDRACEMVEMICQMV